MGASFLKKGKDFVHWARETSACCQATRILDQIIHGFLFSILDQLILHIIFHTSLT